MYRLKPLEWEEGGGEAIAATSIYEEYVVRQGEYGWDSDTWTWSLHIDRMFECHRCDSLEHGKQLAEAHWRERVLPMLEPVDLDEPEHMILVAADRLEDEGDERVPLLRAAISQRDTAKAIAEVIARDLFTDGDERRAERLQLRHGTPDGGDRPGGGWSEGVVADHIEWRLTTADETFHPQT